MSLDSSSPLTYQRTVATPKVADAVAAKSTLSLRRISKFVVGTVNEVTKSVGTTVTTIWSSPVTVPSTSFLMAPVRLPKLSVAVAVTV